ncbi:hypothetical protein KsCSTR_12590 [Candidatus Kuenenia stuttgartiensis]|uniref:Uncharacterized protein n=1 Tax=Kuenenia stuttgartiensis TaxID=174633 RepID=Q1Q0G8_KUEST|nr:hypothetical protein KsCSTR_12590 [Candidatus Kuenenia stuttgartiensis]CAJ72014.1 unknown protein [Candidatus Kuenenia stuttgartiensis]
MSPPVTSSTYNILVLLHSTKKIISRIFRDVFLQWQKETRSHCIHVCRYASIVQKSGLD